MIIIELALQTENCDIDLSKDFSLPNILPFADLIVRVSVISHQSKYRNATKFSILLALKLIV